jgi:hypothetical protein
VPAEEVPAEVLVEVLVEMLVEVLVSPAGTPLSELPSGLSGTQWTFALTVAPFWKRPLCAGGLYVMSAFDSIRHWSTPPTSPALPSTTVGSAR